MTQQTWSGTLVRKARAHFLPMVLAGDCVCPKCQLPIVPGQRWQVGHQVPRALGGSHDLTNLAPEHGGCNESDGSRVRSAVRGSRRRPTPPIVKRREW